MTDEQMEPELADELRRDERARGLILESQYLDQAANIASGCGEHGLANRIWALSTRKARQAGVIRGVLKRFEKPNPKCPCKCDCDEYCVMQRIHEKEAAARVAETG